MKNIILIGLVSTMALLAQRPGNGPILQATPQQAQVLTIPLTATQATMLETARINNIDRATGMPKYATISAYVAAHQNMKQLFRETAHDYPTAGIQAAQQAARTAEAAVQAAIQAASKVEDPATPAVQ